MCKCIVMHTRQKFTPTFITQVEQFTVGIDIAKTIFTIVRAQTLHLLKLSYSDNNRYCHGNISPTFTHFARRNAARSLLLTQITSCRCFCLCWVRTSGRDWKQRCRRLWPCLCSPGMRSQSLPRPWCRTCCRGCISSSTAAPPARTAPAPPTPLLPPPPPAPRKPSSKMNQPHY